ncbi:hypothetical protein Pedsa_3375 [Pseudopedobacter saltans DSM 12145]|uniref:Uncharacterized protein n=1 Tax=Pseudopedobacter saltans (strain ATCC 51119 / DSM 12145 / JCM 21818 / CCUG 39354 / LMG 10337 / NBRC 100064 / NCIMB 13643) TaxID=762903 RepID=F0SCR6_PSESL|nr:hypothetical protein [Pseudopedobacter saltans]ADY53910.1 hypothetical protein Pedsa_3375 [Pseudopedobacter saltans DSM 12145]
MRKLLLLVAFFATTAILFSSCSKDKDENGSIGGKVQYKLIGSSNVAIHTIQITDGNGQVSSVAASEGNTWTSDEITLNKKGITLQLGAGGIVSSGTGELKAQILIDGKVVQESNNSANAGAIAAVVYYQF